MLDLKKYSQTHRKKMSMYFYSGSQTYFIINYRIQTNYIHLSEIKKQQHQNLIILFRNVDLRFDIRLNF